MRRSEYPESPKTLGQIIRKKRMDSKLSLLEVAKRAEITEGYLSRIEADKQVPAPGKMEAIGKVLGIDETVYNPFLLEKLFPQDSPVHQLNHENTKASEQYHHTLNIFTKVLQKTDDPQLKTMMKEAIKKLKSDYNADSAKNKAPKQRK